MFEFDSLCGRRWKSSPPFPNIIHFFAVFSFLSFSRSNVGSVLVSKISQQMQIENQLAFTLYYANILHATVRSGGQNQKGA